MHPNARTTLRSREDIVRLVLTEGRTVKAAAAAFTVCPKTVRKWLARYHAAGPAGLRERTSRPHHSPQRLTPERRAQAVQWRQQGLVYAEIAQRTGLSEATLSRVLRAVPRHPPPPVVPVVRYERATPGELLHLDIKRLGRIQGVGHRITGDPRDTHPGAGWECVHVCIDDHSRVAYADVRADQKRHTAVAFLETALAYYAALGVRAQRVMTDNGSCYRSAAFRKACAHYGLKHLRTQPYTPKTNGKAERFIQSSLREWAYVRPYAHSDQRTAELPRWLHRYNWHRPHRSLHRFPPISRLNLGDNVLTTHT
jgi:transposase InsO family protein